MIIRNLFRIAVAVIVLLKQVKNLNISLYLKNNKRMYLFRMTLFNLIIHFINLDNKAVLIIRKERKISLNREGKL